MIPASYLFKTAYDQAWTYPDVTPRPAAASSEQATRFIDGLFSPIAAVVTWLRHARPDALGHRSFARD